MDEEIKKIKNGLLVIGFFLGAIFVLVIGIAYKLEIFWWQ